MNLRRLADRLVLGKPVENGIHGHAYVAARTRAPNPTRSTFDRL